MYGSCSFANRSDVDTTRQCYRLGSPHYDSSSSLFQLPAGVFVCRTTLDERSSGGLQVVPIPGVGSSVVPATRVWYLVPWYQVLHKCWHQGNVPCYQVPGTWYPGTWYRYHHRGIVDIREGLPVPGSYVNRYSGTTRYNWDYQYQGATPREWIHVRCSQEGGAGSPTSRVCICCTSYNKKLNF